MALSSIARRPQSGRINPVHPWYWKHDSCLAVLGDFFQQKELLVKTPISTLIADEEKAQRCLHGDREDLAF